MQLNGLQTLFDAGAGNALSAEIACEFEAIKVTAWEIEASRIKNKNFPNQVIRQADLFLEDIPKCQVTYLYLPTGPLLERVLSQLSDGDLIAAVESHGELFDRLDEQCELVAELKITAKRHHPNLRIYRYKSILDSIKSQLRHKSFDPSEFQLLVKEEDALLGDSIWMADCYGLTITPDEFVETVYPPRRFKLAQVMNIVKPISSELIMQRREGKWRKIFLAPRPLAETPAGERIEVDGSKVAVEQIKEKCR